MGKRLKIEPAKPLIVYKVYILESSPTGIINRQTYREQYFLDPEKANQLADSWCRMMYSTRYGEGYEPDEKTMKTMKKDGTCCWLFFYDTRMNVQSEIPLHVKIEVEPKTVIQ